MYLIQNVILLHQNYSRYSALIHIHPVFTFESVFVEEMWSTHIQKCTGIAEKK